MTAAAIRANFPWTTSGPEEPGAMTACADYYVLLAAFEGAHPKGREIAGTPLPTDH